MKANERGNAILISAILVFGLTITALGVSRMLVKGTQGMVPQREFLGVQANAICEAAIWRWVKDPTINRTLPQGAIAPDWADFSAGRAGGADYPVSVAVKWTSGAVVAPNAVYYVTANAAVSSADGTQTVQREVKADVVCPVLGACVPSQGPVFTHWTP